MQINIPLKPISTNHCYRVRIIKGKGNSGMPMVYMTKEGKDFKKEVQKIIKSIYKGSTFKGDIQLNIELRFKDKRGRDIDNYNKILLDSMTGLIYDDDKQIIDLHLKKTSGWLNDEIILEISEISCKNI